jgi:hypothetical protein
MASQDTSFTTRVSKITAAWAQAVNDFIHKGRDPQYVTSTGSGTAYVVTLPSTSLYSAYADGDSFTFKAHAANTGAATLQIVGASSLTATAMQLGGAALTGGEIQIGDVVTVKYDGTQFQLQNVNALHNALAEDTGASLVSYLPSGTAQSRTVSKRLQDVPTVLDYIPTAQHAAIKAGTSTYDAATDLATGLAAESSLLVPDGYSTIYLGSELTIPDGKSIYAATPYLTGFKLGASGARIRLGTHSVLRGLLIDGNYTATHCVIFDDASNFPQILQCLIQKATSRGVLADEDGAGGAATNWQLVGSRIRLIGNRNSSTGEPSDNDAHALEAKGPGNITDSVLGVCTGNALRLTGISGGEEVRVQMVGGRLNFSFDELFYVDGAAGTNRVSLMLNGVYCENPQIAQEGASGAGINSSLVRAGYATGAQAFVSISQPKKYMARLCTYAVESNDGAQVFVDGNFPAVGQATGGPTVFMFGATSSDVSGGDAKEPGTIKFTLPDLVGDSTDWLGLVKSQAGKNGINVIPRSMRRVARILNGLSTTGTTTNGGSLAVDNTAGNFLSDGGALKFTGDGATSTANSFATTWTPTGLEGETLMFVAAMRGEQAGASWNGSLRLRANGTGIMWTNANQCTPVSDDPGGAGNQNDWRYFQTFVRVTDESLAITVTVNLKTATGTSDDIVYVDHVDVYAIEGRKSDYGQKQDASATPTSDATAGNATISAAEIATGIYVRDCAGSGRTDTFDTAANIVAAFPGCKIGDIIRVLVINGSDGAETITLAEGSGGSWDANQTAGSRVVPQNSSKLVHIRLTNVTASSEAYVIYA